MAAHEPFHSLMISLRERLPCYSHFDLTKDCIFIDTLTEILTSSDRLEGILIGLSDLLHGVNVFLFDSGSSRDCSIDPVTVASIAINGFYNRKSLSQVR
jgi:hypothetical protein